MMQPPRPGSESWPGAGQAEGEGGEEGWVDLARNVAGVGLSKEAVRRQLSEGADAARLWWVGGAAEERVGELLDALVKPSWWQRLRRRPVAWRVLHSVPLHGADGEEDSDIDHVLIGPPGVVTINVKDHPGARVSLDADTMTVGEDSVDYVRKARAEAQRARELLRTAIGAAGYYRLAGQLVVRALIVLIGARLDVQRPADKVLVRMSRDLVHTVQQLPVTLQPGDVERLFEIARRSTTWTHP